jgi:AraC family transcriptional regulator
MTEHSIANPVAKTLWYIEAHLESELSLDVIAAQAGTSRFHLSRSFSAVCDMPVMHYARGRRLTEAARKLLNGAPDILSVALDTGYGSHEAFTRAFREQFAVTPESVRDRVSLAGLDLVEAKRVDVTSQRTLDEPRIERGRVLLIAGLTEREHNRIPVLWQKFGPHMGSIPTQVGHVGYGVCANGDENGNYTYIAGVEVERFDRVPPELTTIRIPAVNYAVFTHRDHITALRATFDAIFRQWQPHHEVLDAPFFERYGDDFDPRTGTGPVEIWVPIP